MKMIKLTMATGRMAATANDGEDDGLAEIREVTQPVMVAVDQIRNFYPRKPDRVGTRILFRNGSALPVVELFDEVEQKLREALDV
jgi:hypothetical protein